MDNQITDLITNTKHLDKRSLASGIRSALSDDFYVESRGENTTKEDFIIQMIVNLLTSGEAITATGQSITIGNFKDWFDLMKFVSVHLEGRVDNTNQFQGINIFKVYAGIDVDKV